MENPWEYLSFTTWRFSPGERNLIEARSMLALQIRSLKPKQIISIQEKEDEIVCWMVL